MIIGRLSIVTSANQTIWRASPHSLRIASSTIITMSRALPTLSLANSATGIPGIGNVVCAPLSDDMFMRAISGELKIGRGRLLAAVDQLVAIDDLQNAALVGAVTKIDAIAGRTSRDRPMQFGRHHARGAR